MPIKDLATHPEKFVLVPELADYWRVTEQSVYRWIRKGALRATRVGGVLRVRTADALAFGPAESCVEAPAASIRR